MSYGASIYSHVYNPPITAEVHCGISRGQGWRPGTIVKSAPSKLEIETPTGDGSAHARMLHAQIAARHRQNWHHLTPIHDPGGGKSLGPPIFVSGQYREHRTGPAPQFAWRALLPRYSRNRALRMRRRTYGSTPRPVARSCDLEPKKWPLAPKPFRCGNFLT